MYVLTLLHPKLPEHIRDKFKVLVASDQRRIMDIRAEILSESDLFLNGDERQDVHLDQDARSPETPYDEVCNIREPRFATKTTRASSLQNDETNYSLTENHYIEVN